MNLREVIFDPAWHVLLSIERRAGVWDETGEWDATYAPDEVDAVVHPATPSDLLMLAEGERAHPTIHIFAAQPLGFGDKVHWKGEIYKVTFLQDWNDYGFFDCLAVRPSRTAAPDGAAFGTG
ncbi:hypothetical protein AB3X94_37250 [Paraburkholderia sp. BR10923]|uniref:hypothetical protein n=1 Tax=Paraburkholderia sp. BR10923 TaxID=3236992 RepID=UPI0034CDDDFA